MKKCKCGGEMVIYPNFQLNLPVNPKQLKTHFFWCERCRRGEYHPEPSWSEFKNDRKIIEKRVKAN